MFGHEEWYEKWQDALDAYNTTIANKLSTPEVQIGRMRLLRNLLGAPSAFQKLAAIPLQL